MARGKRDANFNSIYALYNKYDEIVCVGTRRELAEFLGCTPDQVSNMSWREKKGQQIGYRVYYIGEEPVTEKKCVVCGEVKPVSEFPYNKNAKGVMIPLAKCKDCYKKYNREKARGYRKKKEAKE